MHGRNAAVAQVILGSGCAHTEVVRPCDAPEDDEREFFATAWCLDPRSIVEEQVVFIPEPPIPGAVEEGMSELPGLRYTVRLRLVALQDWTTPPASPRGDG